PSNDYNRYTTRINLENKIIDNLKLSTKFSGIQEKTKEPAPPGGVEFTNMMQITGQSIREQPVFPGRLSNGDFGRGRNQYGTPYSYLKNESFYNEKPFSGDLNMRLDWDMLSTLKLSLIGGYLKKNFISRNFL